MTIYIVTDIRTVPEGNAVLVNTTQHSQRLSAEARYHSALAAAANSEQYPVYSAIMMTNDGFVLESKFFEHEIQPEPEPEPETEE